MPYRSFLKSLFWNSLNVILYKIIFQAHQAYLFYTVTKEFFGIGGTLFSTIYLLINLTNFGFDYSLFSFHKFYAQSQQNFRWFIQQCLIRSGTLLVVIALAGLLLHTYAAHTTFAQILRAQSATFFILLALIFFSESLKKSLELFANLSFLHQTVTLLEIFMLTSYIALVWTSYWHWRTITLHTLFAPLVLTSLIELGIITYRLLLFYRTLPASLPTNTTLSHTVITRNQMSNYINQVAKTLFSPNFIIIFLAYHLGFAKAGIIKLIIDTVILLYIFMHRAVGIPSAALFSKILAIDATQTTDNTITSNQPISTMIKDVFVKITNYYLQALYAIAIVLFFIAHSTHASTAWYDPVITSNIIFFTLAGFLEYIPITYEKFFLTHHTTHKLTIINIASLLLIIPTLYASTILPQSYILIPFIMIRCSSIIILVAITYKTWNLLPSFHISLKTILISLTSILLYLFFITYLQK